MVAIGETGALIDLPRPAPGRQTGPLEEEPMSSGTRGRTARGGRPKHLPWPVGKAGADRSGRWSGCVDSHAPCSSYLPRGRECLSWAGPVGRALPVVEPDSGQGPRAPVRMPVLAAVGAAASSIEQPKQRR
jgi:hypothetical protein